MVRRNGDHVLGVEMFAELPIPTVVMQRIVASVQAVVEEYEADRNRREAETAAPERYDWAALGWAGHVEHDAVFAELAEICRSYPPVVQEHLRRRWAEKGWRLPLALVDMDEWDRVVRSAPRVVAQDVAAEGSTVESEVA